jgi:hypothetical protein
VQRHSVEYLNLRTAFDHQTLDNVETIQLGQTRDNVGQIPAGSWSRSADTLAVVQDASSLEYVADGPKRGERLDLALLKLVANGHSPILSKVALLPQLLADGQYQILPIHTGAVDGSRCSRGPVFPIHAVPLFVRPLDPPLYGGQSDSELPGNGS